MLLLHTHMPLPMPMLLTHMPVFYGAGVDGAGYNGYALGYNGYNTHFIGKRSAEAEAEPEAWYGAYNGYAGYGYGSRYAGYARPYSYGYRYASPYYGGYGYGK